MRLRTVDPWIEVATAHEDDAVEISQRSLRILVVGFDTGNKHRSPAGAGDRRHVVVGSHRHDFVPGAHNSTAHVGDDADSRSVARVNGQAPMSRRSTPELRKRSPPA